MVLTTPDTPWRSWPGIAMLLGGSLLLLLVTWPVQVGPPAAGLDPSWQAGLAMAWRDGLQYGQDLVFTYGPWGFLRQPLLYDLSAYRLSVLNVLALRAVEAALVWILLSYTWGRGWGLLLAALTLWVAAAVDPALIIAIAVTVFILRDIRRRVPTWVIALLGVFAGFELLGKANTGVEVAMLLGAAVCFGPAPRGRNVAVYVAGVAGGALAGWLAAGQALGDIPSFVWGVGQIMAGYTPAMAVTDPAVRLAYWAALAVAVVVAIGVRSALRSEPHIGGPGLVIATCILVYLGFKEGFVRESPGRAAASYVSVVAALTAMLPWDRAHRREAGLALLVVVTAYLGVASVDPAAIVNPRQSPGDLARTVRLAFREGERNRIVEQGRAQMNAGYALRPEVLAELRGFVHVVPWELGVVWSHRLRWKPLYVFQDYSAYTSYLDGRNAEQLAGAHAPDRLLQAAAGSTIDGRLAAWEPPRQQVEILCRWRPVVAQAGWRVLERRPQRCGRPRTVAVVRTSWGGAVAVPASAPDELMTVRVTGIELSLVESVLSLAWKPAQRFTAVNGSVVRLVAATAGDGLLLRAPASIDPPGAFRIAPGARTLRFLRGRPGAPQHGGEITLRFEVRKVDPA